MSEDDRHPTEVAGSLSHRSRSTSPEGQRPPLPPRPSNLSIFRGNSTNPVQRPATRGTLLSTATTAVSLTDVNTNARHDGTRELRASGVNRTASAASVRSRRSVAQFGSGKTSDAGDASSILSYVPNDTINDVESLFDDQLGLRDEDAGDKEYYKIFDTQRHFEDVKVDFADEFSSIDEVEADRSNEELLLKRWKSKKKHFIILSAAGKPIYSRHGDENLTSGYVGIIQTIISFYKGAEDPLNSFTAGGVKFVILSRGPLFLLAITKFFENDAQLRAQLDALYMQILSTLTLPTLEHLFSVRPSTDLRRPLQGTEVLLSSLADTFTRGSPSTLLSALECLKLRKSHRQVINSTLLRFRADNLLYGLVVAGGRLVSVIRPKKHSLHPSDLQLIFNMIFEAEGIKAGGGESWIPICLPGFNNKGYLHMYVSFLSLSGDSAELQEDDNVSKEEAVAVIFISADKESFYNMRKMRDDLVEELEKNNSVKVLRHAVQQGRPAATDFVSGTVIRHFLYKSKANVQFVMPSYIPQFSTPEARRSLLSTYHILHDSVHARHSHVKVHHSIGSSAALAWETPIFEFYAVASANAPRNALAQSATRVIQWVQREEARIFILGGAVF